jgi:hypothetical protein
VLPPSIHTSGEEISWDPEVADAMAMPAEVAALDLFKAVRRIAVHAFLARHMGGVEAAHRYIESRGASAPGLKPEVIEHARLLEGLPPRVGEPRPSTGRGTSPEARLRSAGIEAVAARLGLEWDSRRKALRVCPSCRADTRSDHDKRSAAGVIISRKSGHELAVHGKCGFVGDAVTVAILEMMTRGSA